MGSKCSARTGVVLEASFINYRAPRERFHSFEKPVHLAGWFHVLVEPQQFSVRVVVQCIDHHCGQSIQRFCLVSGTSDIIPFSFHRGLELLRGIEVELQASSANRRSNCGP